MCERRPDDVVEEGVIDFGQGQVIRVVGRVRRDAANKRVAFRTPVHAGRIDHERAAFEPRRRTEVEDAPAPCVHGQVDAEQGRDRARPCAGRVDQVVALEALRVQNCWSGYYEYNVLDQNAIIGPHPAVSNCIFANGFSGHGLQQGPATGRGVSELILSGRYTTLDLSALSFERVLKNQPIVEKNVV